MSTDFSNHEETARPADVPAVLIVDDDSKNLVAIESVLDGVHFKLVKAQTGSEALLELIKGDFAVIVLDIQMPDMSGIELARMIKQRKRTQHIPVIFLTAHYREDEHAVLGYDAGAVDYLVKPINPNVLRSKVNVFVDLFKKTRALEKMNLMAEAAENALRVANEELATRNEALEREAEERERRIQAEFAQAEAEEANAAKDRFLAMLSHELRTPLSPIIHAVTLLEQCDCPPDMRESIATIRRNVRLEARLIDDLLDLARIRNGKLLLEFQPVSLLEILTHALDICRPDLAARGIHIQQNISTPEVYVQADTTRLQQVFWNLIVNAMKFSPPGGEINLRTFAHGTDRVAIEIEDYGVGIAPEKLDRIFNAFDQGARHTQTGLGLGLAICKALVEMHHGEITAYSRGINCGAKFTVTLPCVSAAENAPVKSPQVSFPSNALRLLLVEDHVDTLETLQRLLVQQGYTVLTATSIAEALRVADQSEFDVLVSDIGLPDGRGTDLLEQLVKRGRRPPSIAMSGFGMDGDLERSFQAGFSEHLTKPVEFTALHLAISRIASMSGK